MAANDSRCPSPRSARSPSSSRVAGELAEAIVEGSVKKKRQKKKAGHMAPGDSELADPPPRQGAQATKEAFLRLCSDENEVAKLGLGTSAIEGLLKGLAEEARGQDFARFLVNLLEASTA